MRTARRRLTRRRYALLLLTALFLSACGPDTQERSTTTLDGEDNIQESGVIVPQERQDTPEVAAAKAIIPYQYREKNPPNLFAFGTNLNPNSNRSTRE